MSKPKITAEQRENLSKYYKDLDKNFQGYASDLFETVPELKDVWREISTQDVLKQMVLTQGFVLSRMREELNEMRAAKAKADLESKFKI